MILLKFFRYKLSVKKDFPGKTLIKCFKSECEQIYSYHQIKDVLLEDKTKQRFNDFYLHHLINPKFDSKQYYHCINYYPKSKLEDYVGEPAPNLVNNCR